MGKVKVAAFSVSLDGFAAGPNQSLENPLGIGGEGLHPWFRKTKVFQTLFGNADGTTDQDNRFAEKSFENVGAWIMGRNMFGPLRGPWPNEDWKGWWGDNPPYHTPVFVLTHHQRAPLQMEGATTFHFVTEGIQSALAKAKQAAGDRDIRIGGGVATIRAYLQGGLIDELHLAYSPVFLGSGESLLAGINLPGLGYRLVEKTLTAEACHLVLQK